MGVLEAMNKLVRPNSYSYTAYGGYTLFVSKMMLSLCLISIGVWYGLSCANLIIDFERIGVPKLLISFSSAVFIAGGIGLVFDRISEKSAVILIAWLMIISSVIHSDLSIGGIGGYPNLKAILVNLATIGSLLLIVGASQNTLNPSLISRRILFSGRFILAAYFVINAVWQWLYIETRMEHVAVSGGNPNSVWGSIIFQLVGGVLVFLGRYVRTGTALLAIPLVASTIVVHGNLEPSAPYPPYVQVHQWFVKSSILSGLLSLASFRWQEREET